MDVVLYMRYSSDKQTEQSIEGQERICKEYCKQQGYKIVNKYIDRATSAFKDAEKRTAFNQMIKDSDKQDWQAVIVYKLDRFARNRYDSATYKAKLKKNGVKVLSATENISDNPEGIILEAVLEGMAEFYSRELSQKITRGMMESAYKCNSVGGSIPIGYKIENKKLVIDPPKAKIVKEAFDLYANGVTVTAICEQFNQKGYTTAKQTAFNKNSFRSMFKNEKYAGVYMYKDFRIENGVPAIVDRETFDTVQKRLKKNFKAPANSKAKVDYLLSQKLFCGHCGAPMTGECGKSKSGKMYYYYACSNRKRFKNCDKKSVKKDLIERAVAEITLSLITPENIQTLADMAIKQNIEDIENDKIISGLKVELKEIDKSISNLIKLVEKGIESEALSSRLIELETQRKAVSKQLKNAQGQYIILEREHIIWWLTQFCQGDIEDEEFRKNIIDLLVNSVTVWDDPGGLKITIIYNLIDKQEQTFTINECSTPVVNGPPAASCRSHDRGCATICRTLYHDGGIWS